MDNGRPTRLPEPSGGQVNILVTLYIDLLTINLQDKPILSEPAKKCISGCFAFLLKHDSEENITAALRQYMKRGITTYAGSKGWPISLFQEDYNGFKASLRSRQEEVRYVPRMASGVLEAREAFGRLSQEAIQKAKEWKPGKEEIK